MNIHDSFDRSINIVFDRHVRPTDLSTGVMLQPCCRVQKGSVRFYENRLDNEVNHINYMFASMVSVDVERLALLRKLAHPNIWAIVTKNGDSVEGLSPVMSADIVKTYAVSFIPLKDDGSTAETRVYVLLEDLYVIQWSMLDHWLVSTSQEQYELEQGIWH